MDMTLYAGLVSFVIVMSITPGPNNLMLMSSSALFGVRATLPAWIGVNLGFNILLVAAVFGLGGLVARFPWAMLLVKSGGAIWLVWMAWLFLRAGIAPGGADGKPAAPHRSRPIASYEAALFQLVNPKALLMTLSSAGAYIALAEAPGERAVVMVATFVSFGAPCGLLWVFAGGALKRFMADGRSARILNLAIAVILLVTTAMIVLG